MEGSEEGVHEGALEGTLVGNIVGNAVGIAEGTIDGIDDGIDYKKAIEIMSRDNIDISDHSSNTIDEYLDKDITHVITVCDHANENCPVYLKKSNLTHQNFFDPSKVVGNEKERKIAFEKCRDEIKVFCLNYLNKILARN